MVCMRKSIVWWKKPAAFGMKAMAFGKQSNAFGKRSTASQMPLKPSSSYWTGRVIVGFKYVSA